MPVSDNDLVFGLIFGVGLGFLGGFGVSSCLDSTYNRFPKEDTVQAGYVVPSKLEVELLDLDGNGKQETSLKYGNQRYLLLVDEQGKVKVETYGSNPQTK